MQPLAALHHLVVEDVGPPALWQIVVHVSLFGEDRSHQQALAQQILPVQIRAGDVLGEFQHHGPHHGNAGLVGLHGLGVQIGHQGALQLGELAHHVHRLLVEQPGHPVGVGPVEPGVGGQQAERCPTLVHIGRGSALKAADVVAPEGEAGQAQRQARPQALAHGQVVGGAVAAPVHRELLPAGSGAAGKQAGLVVALILLQQLKHALIIKISIVVVHQHRVAAVVVDTVCGNALAEVGLEAVHTHVQQLPQLVLIPLPGSRVGKVHQAHAGLPHVPLPHIPVGTLEQISMLHALLEQGGLLADIGVDPHADL